MGKYFIISYLFVIILFYSCSQDVPDSGFFDAAQRVSLRNDSVNVYNPIAEGNGTLYFSFDVTGLQTFAADYEKGIALETKLKRKGVCINTGFIGLELNTWGNSNPALSDLKDISQDYDLSTGIAHSRFSILKHPVHITTICHPYYNMISVRIISDLIPDKALKIKLIVPLENETGIIPSLTADSNNVAIISVKTQDYPYDILIWKNNAEIMNHSSGVFYIEPPVSDTVYSFSCQFLVQDSTGRIQTFGETEKASRKSWKQFWTNISPAMIPEQIRGNDKEKDYILNGYFNRIKTCSKKD